MKVVGSKPQWVESLTDDEQRFLSAWSRQYDTHGALAAALRSVRRDLSSRQVSQQASRWLTRLDQKSRPWRRRKRGKAAQLPPLTKPWLLEQVDAIARIRGIADHNIGQALMLRQKLDPVDVRTYPDFVVDYLKPVQWEVYQDDHRFRVVVAGRRSGKTHEAVTECITDASAAGHNCYYLSKTRKNVKKAPWTIFKKLVHWEYVDRISEQESFARFTNGSEIQFDGVEEPDNLRGDGLTFLVLEEFASWKNGKKIWDQVLRPMLADRKGRALFIGTPAGFNHFRHMFLLGENPDEGDWSAHHTTTLAAGVVDAEEVEAAKRNTDPRSFRQEWEATFEQLANQVYDYFDRSKHVTDELMETGLRLLVGIDFNLDPMTAVIAQKDAKGDCEVLEALELSYSNTEELCEDVEDRYPDATFLAYPDPSGRSRHTAAGGKTDFSIIDDRPRWKVDEVMRRKSIPLADKINNVQANLQDAAGGRHMKIHPVQGMPLIEALEGLTYLEGTSQPDKKSGFDHITDAFGYLLWGAFNRFKQRIKVGKFSI